MTSEKLFRVRMHTGTATLPAVTPGATGAVTFGLASRPIVLTSFDGSHPVRANTPWAVASDGSWRVVTAETTDLRLIHGAGLPVRTPGATARPIRFEGAGRKVMRAAIKSMTPSWIDGSGNPIADLAPYGPAEQRRARLRPVVPIADRDTVAAFVMMATWALEHGRPDQDQRLDRVLAYIDAHVADPDLTTTTVAAGTRLSRRTLQSLFVAHGGLAGHIRRQRLAVALRQLTADPTTFPDLEAVARGTGLGSRRTLERAMRRVYGITPRQAREHLLAGGVLREAATVAAS